MSLNEILKKYGVDRNTGFYDEDGHLVDDDTNIDDYDDEFTPVQE